MTTKLGGLRGMMARRAPVAAATIVEVEFDLLTARVISQVELPVLTVPVLDAGVFQSLSNPQVSEDLYAIARPQHAETFIPLNAPQVCKQDALDRIAAPTHDSSPFEPLAQPTTNDIRFRYLLQQAEIVDMFVPLEQPVINNLRFRYLLQPAEIVSLFEPLEQPGRAGKRYAAATRHIQMPLDWDAVAPERTGPKNGADLCRHGMARSLCSICSDEEAARRSSRSTTPVRTVDVFELLRPYLQPPLEALLADPLLFPVGKRPFDYQVEGIKFMAERPSALLGDEMGLGKTIQAIVALQVLYRRGKIRSTLVLCPRSLLGVWEREMEKWAPECYVLRVRGSRAERLELWRAPATIYLTTYETLREDIDHVVRLHSKFGVVVLDEVQKIKNAATATTRAVRRVQAQYRWGLSGTPLENRVEDVTTIYDYLKPGLFNAGELPKPDDVKKRIQPFFLRRRTADVRKELPAKVTNEVWLELSDRQRLAYQRKEVEGRGKLTQPGVTRVHVFALINELKQICNFEPLSGESCKADYLEEQLGSIVESGQKALVFSHLPHVSLAKLEPRLKEYVPALFDGSLSDQRRETLIAQFQKQDQAPHVLLMSVQAGGVGITLTAANHVFHFDHWWNPAVARQAEGRAHRIGQASTVFVHDIFTVQTIEQRIYNLLKSKQELFDKVIDDLSSEQVVKAITDEELFGLFGLRPPTSTKVVVPTAPLPPVVQNRPAAAGPAQYEAEVPRPREVANASAPKHRKLSDLDPIEFEHYIAGLYSRMGYKTKVTPPSHDHGVDIFAKRFSASNEELLIIQCKHRVGGTVGEAEVRELIGVLQIYPQANGAILVTSGTFSQSAVTLATEHRVHLVDIGDLRQLIDKVKS